MNPDRCVRCGEPHTYDETRGWRAEDGHAYLRDARPPAPTIDDEPAESGFTRADVLGLVTCLECAMPVRNLTEWIEVHRRFHARLEAWHAGQTVSA